MNGLFIVGRVALVLIFIITGAQKLMDIAGTAAMIESKIAIPAMLADVAAKITETTGLSAYQLLAIVAGVVEFAGALLIVFNVGTRWVALVLAAFTLVATYFFHDFWNMSGQAYSDNVIQVLKNLSMFGGLLVLASYPSWRPVDPDRYA